jgi:hypothetical protein
MILKRRGKGRNMGICTFPCPHVGPFMEKGVEDTFDFERTSDTGTKYVNSMVG